MAVSLMPVAAQATPKALAEAMLQAYGKRTLNTGRIRLNVPALAESGHSVALRVAVDSPMIEDDYVKRIDIYSEANPLPVVVRFELTPMSGLAEVHTRIRLADSQTISAVAELSDGSLWLTSTKTIVTLAACTDFLI